MLRVGSGGVVAVMVGSRVKVVSMVGVVSEVGVACAVGEATSTLGVMGIGSVESLVCWTVLVGTRVGVGERGIAVAEVQAAIETSRMQVRNIRQLEYFLFLHH